MTIEQGAKVVAFPAVRTGRTADDVPLPAGDNQACPCGEEWWTGGSVVFTKDGSVTGYTIDWRCAACGREYAP